MACGVEGGGGRCEGESGREAERVRWRGAGASLQAAVAIAIAIGMAQQGPSLCYTASSGQGSQCCHQTRTGAGRARVPIAIEQSQGLTGVEPSPALPTSCQVRLARSRLDTICRGDGGKWEALALRKLELRVQSRGLAGRGRPSPVKAVAEAGATSVACTRGVHCPAGRGFGCGGGGQRASAQAGDTERQLQQFSFVLTSTLLSASGVYVTFLPAKLMALLSANTAGRGWDSGQWEG